MGIANIKTPEDIFEYLNDNIDYGWLDYNHELHLNTLKDFRQLYRTASLEEIIKYQVGTCIEQVILTSSLLTKLNIPNKNFCMRILKPNAKTVTYNETSYPAIEEDNIHTHCFVLHYLEGDVYQIEHANFEEKAIKHFISERAALDYITKNHLKKTQGELLSVVEFSEIPAGLSYPEFNKYIDELEVIPQIKL